MGATPDRHCWVSESEQFVYLSPEWGAAKQRGDPVCWLPDGHEGPHAFTPAEDIVVSDGREFPHSHTKDGPCHESS